ncbi:hypothetical protein [Palaeococcus sp. (in: euryarchaeotes)]
MAYMKKGGMLISLILMLSLLGASTIKGAVFIQNPGPPIVVLGNPYPKYLSVAPNETFSAYFYVVEDLDIAEMKGYYRVNGGEWINRKILQATVNENPDVYNSLFGRFTTGNITLRTFFGKITIPPQPAGSKVEFKIVVKDVEGHVTESQHGIYFTSNPEGKKVLIVDPNVKTRTNLLNLNNISEMLNLTKEHYPYDMSDLEKIVEDLKPMENYSLLFPEHHWELLGEKYNIGIVGPDELEDALKDFKPKVVILSNLWLKEWELSQESIKSLLDYLRENNGGLIVTHGTLYDGMASMDGSLRLVGTRHIGNFDNFDESLASALGLYMLPVLEEAKNEALKEGMLSIAGIPSIQSFVTSKGKLGMKDIRIISSQSELDYSNKGVYTDFGWQYLLPEKSLSFAEPRIRSSKDSTKESLSMLSSLHKAKFGGSTYQKSIYALDFPLIDAVQKLNVMDDKMVIPVGTDEVELSGTQDVIEKVRLLKAINKNLVEISALSDDYMLSIITKDEKARGDGIRSAYVSFNIEAGGEKEFNVLSDLVEWTSNFKAIQTFAPIVQVTLLSNDIDWAIKGTELKGKLESMGAMVTRVSASEFGSYKNSKLIVILGGPKAYDGVGDYVKQVLSEEEQQKIINGEQGIFIKRDVWRNGQIVIVIAGQGRTETGMKVSTYEKGIDEGYMDYLADFMVG